MFARNSIKYFKMYSLCSILLAVLILPVDNNVCSFAGVVFTAEISFICSS